MNNIRKIALCVGVIVLVGVLAVGGLVVMRSSSSSDAAASESSASTRGGRASGAGATASRSFAPADDGGSTTSASPGDASHGATSDHGTSVGNAEATSGSTSGTTPTYGTPEPSSSASSSTGDAGSSGSASSSGGGSPVSPVGDRAVWGPVTPISPVPGVPVLDGGPTISSPTWSCGSKIIFSVTVTDPNGVASVYGSYYVGGAKQGFSSSNSSGNVWSTTLVVGTGVPVTSLVVWAKDSMGNTTSLAVGSLCA